MKNALEAFRRDRKMTYRDLAHACGGERSLYAVYRHCKSEHIPAESAMVYAKNLGIPRSELRPDLWPPGGLTATPTTPPEPEPGEGGGDG